MDYIKVYNSLMNKAQEREWVDGYHEIHHIIPTSIGGGNIEYNLVRLTLKEHWIAHCLLVKIFDYEYPDLIFSLECFFSHQRKVHMDIRKMPRWVRRRIHIRRAQLRREYGTYRIY